MSETVELRFVVDGDASGATSALSRAGSAADDVDDKFRQASDGVGGGFDRVGQTALGMNAAVDNASAALAAIDGIQSAAANEANRLARAQADVEQATIDGEQATIDLRQATEDLQQAQIDGQQAAVDLEQARIDAKQADLDAQVALKDHAAALKEHGASSLEAQQAELDVVQALADSKQARVDLTQATADERQATLDASQAKVDGTQASRDAKDAQLDLNEAARAVDPTPIQRAMTAASLYGPVIASAAVATQAFAGTAVAARVATIAGTVATAAQTAAQWALNAAMTANPIGLVIAAIVALVATIVVAYKQSETFRTVVQAAMRGVQAAFGWVLAKVQQLVGWIRGNWPMLLSILTGPIGAAVRFILTRWDSIRTGVVSKTNALLAYVRGIPGRIVSSLGNLSGLLSRAGSAVIDGFLSGIRAGFDRVRSTLSQLTGMLPDWKGPANVDREILRPSGELVAGGFEDGFTSRFARTRAVMGDLTASLPGAVGAGTAGGGGGGGDVHIHTPAVITAERDLMRLIDRARTLSRASYVGAR
jgi:hypothetical protein